MPIYTYQDKKSGKKVDVIRSFNDYENPPTKEEAPGLEDPEWERQIGDNQVVVKGNGWGGGKGYW